MTGRFPDLSPQHQDLQKSKTSIEPFETFTGMVGLHWPS